MSTPLTKRRAAAIPLSSPESNPTAATTSLAPSSPVTPSTAAIAPTIPSPPAQSASSPPSPAPAQEKPKRKLRPAKKAGAPPAQLGYPFPHQRPYACGPKLCELCSKGRPPIGHKTPIPDFVVSTIIRHAMPARFETLEQVKEREVAMGLKKPSKGRKAAESDHGDFEYGPAGEFKPPAWTSDKARPKKSCLRKREPNQSPRFAPYPSPSTQTSRVQRSTEDIRASLDEARANRILLNYEGPNAIAIRNEISAIHIPNDEPFKWEPEYTGPPSEAAQEGVQPLSGATNSESSTTELASPLQEDRVDETAAVEHLPPMTSPSKKRRRGEDNDDDASTDSSVKTIEESPTKKLRTASKLPNTKFPGFSRTQSAPPSFFTPASRTSTAPSAQSPPSPTRSVSPSRTLTPVTTDSSSSDGERLSLGTSDIKSQSFSTRKARITNKKLRFLFSNPASIHPKFGTTDSLYLHHRRANSLSKKVRTTKKAKTYVPLTGEWTESEIEWASLSKGEWDEMRKASLHRKTSRERLENQVKQSEAIDASAERFQKLVDRYEAGWPTIDLAGVRARYIRPKKNEVPREKNKEAMPALVHLDTMRKHYPTSDHPAWEGVDKNTIVEWKKSPHYKLRVYDVMIMVEEEEGERKRVNAEPEDATEVATVVDEEEAKMRREYLAEEVDEVEAPSAAESESVDGGLERQMALSAGEFEGFLTT